MGAVKKEERIKCKCGCGGEFLRRDSKGRFRFFISGHNSVVSNPHKKAKIQQICKFCNKIYFRRPSLANRGKNNYCSNRCRSNNAGSWLSGDKNPNWTGGFNGVQSLRWCTEYRIWRLGVFKRDGFHCQGCLGFCTRDNPLHAHHIKTFSQDKELRFSVSNGITLCKECHRKEHLRRKK